MNKWMHALVLGALCSAAGSGCRPVVAGPVRGEPDFSGAKLRAKPSLRAGDVRLLERGATMRLPPRPADHASRAILSGGRFVLGWTRGDADSGRRALVQAFDANGSPRGSPVVISPPDVEVVNGTVALASEGPRLVATFVARRIDSLDRMVVAIEEAPPEVRDDLTARR
jgi:hypothetical protein